MGWTEMWPDFPKRYQVVIMMSLGMCIIHAQRVNLAVTVVTILDVNSHTKVANIHAAESLPDVTWDAKMIGFLHSVFFIGYIITQIPGGYMTTKMACNRLYGGCILLSCGFNLLVPSALSHAGFPATCLVRFIQGLSEGLLFPSCYAILWHWTTPSERSRLGAVVLAGVYMGAVLGLPLSGALIHYWSWQSVFYLHGSLGVAWAIIWFLISYESPLEHPGISNAEIKFITEQQKETNAIYKDAPVPWFAIMTSLPVHTLNVCHFARSWCFYLLLTNEPVYLDVFGYGIAMNGALSAVPHLAKASLALASGPLADHLMANPLLTATQIRKLFTCLGFGMQSVCFFSLYFVNMGTPALIYLTLGVGASGFTVSGWNINHLDLAPRYASILVAISTTWGTTAGILVPIVVGHMTPKQVIEEWQGVFLLSAGILAFAVLFYAVFGSGKKQPWADPPPSQVNLLSKQDPLKRKLYRTLPLPGQEDNQSGETYIPPDIDDSNNSS